MARFGFLLNEANARGLRSPLHDVDLVLTERTFFDPPRAAAAKRWLAQIERTFPDAEVMPYVWHLVTHAVEDGIQTRTNRTLPGHPHAFGHLQDTAEVAEAWQSSLPCYRAMEAKTIVLRTPSGVTPGAVGRQRLRRFVEQRRADGLNIVWEPDGLWEPFQASHFSQELGITPMARGFSAGQAVPDPTNPDRILGPGIWIRAESISSRPRLSPDQIDDLVAHVEVEPETVLIFGGPLALANFTAVQAALA